MMGKSLFVLYSRIRPFRFVGNAGIEFQIVVDGPRILLHNDHMKTQTELVALYKRIILAKKVRLDDFTVAAMRNAAPDQRAMDALNIAVKDLGYQR